MKVDKPVTVKEDLDITGATLLSIEEARQIPIELRMYNNWWWLRSPGNSYDYTAIVFNNGFIYSYGDYVEDSGIAVRPALKIKNLKSSNFKIGDVFEFADKPFQVISENLAFCLSDIGHIFFRNDWQAENANVYEKSVVKMAIDNWFNEAKEE